MDLYFGFVNYLIESIPKIDIKNNIMSIYLGGSMSRGDYVIGISDIDIYIVVNSIENANEINSEIQDIAKRKLFELLSWCPDGVTVSFTTYNEIIDGTSWLGSNSEYYSFQKTGKLLYGKNIKQEISKPTQSDIIQSSQQAIEQLKQIIQQDVSNINKDKYFVRSIFGTAFSAMYFYLCCENIGVRGKNKITTAFQKKNDKYQQEARNILFLWDCFCHRQLHEDEIDKLINLTRTVVNNN